MGLLPLKFVVSFSSQDPIHTADNILRSSAGTTTFNKKWLCSPCDNTGRLEGEFQLEQASQINFVDIGNCGSATVEIQVGRSSWPWTRDYVTLLPAVTLMTLSEIKAGINKTSVRMLTEMDHLNKEITKQKWDRIRIICCQPYLKSQQFGLSFLRIGNKEDKGHSMVTYKQACIPKTETASGSSPPPEKHFPSSKRTILSSPNSAKAPIQYKIYKMDAGSKLNLHLNGKGDNNLKRKSITDIHSHDSSKKTHSGITKSCALETTYSHQNMATNGCNVHLRNKGHDSLKLKSVVDGSMEGDDKKFKKQVMKFLSLQSYPYSEEDSEILLCAMEKWIRRKINHCEKNVFHNILHQICGNSIKHSFKNRMSILSPPKTRSKLNLANKIVTDVNSSESASQINLSEDEMQPDLSIQKSCVSKENTNISTKVQESLKQGIPMFDLTMSDDDECIVMDSAFQTASSFQVQHEKPNMFLSSEYRYQDESHSLGSTVSQQSKQNDYLQYGKCEMSFTECPICSKVFPAADIESHASECDMFGTNESPNPQMFPNEHDVLTECPICGNLYEMKNIISHADNCADDQMKNNKSF